MKQIHPLSLVLGLAIAVVCMLTMSQLTVQPARIDPYTPPWVTQVEYGPHARDMVTINENAPYTVPRGRRFVLTALGATGLNAMNAQLFVDGQEEASVRLFAGNQASEPHMLAMPPGFTVRAGSTITLIGTAQGGRAWGYLAAE